LLAGIVAVPAMGFQKVVTALAERDGTVAAVQTDDIRESFVTQVAQVRLPPVSRVIARIAEVALRHDPKRAKRCERPAVVAVQFVPMIAVDHDLTFRTARQVEAVDESVSRIVRARSRASRSRASSSRWRASVGSRSD
jgi:hypothetical protein